jgi:tRNA A-37 threonylcarbamoyl transferase component Bud32
MASDGYRGSLDIEQPDALRDYLLATTRIAPAEKIEIRLLTGGVSNRTVLVQLPDRAGNQAWVLKQALAKLRVAVDWFSDPARIDREALGLRWLEELAPPGTTTPLIFHDPANHLLAMTAVPQPHQNWKAVLLAGNVDRDRGGHVEQFGRLLGQIHRRSWERRADVASIFDDRDFFQTLRIEPYYQYTARQVPAAADFLNKLVNDTHSRRLALVHGDYSPKNVLVHAGRLVLIDHEVIHFGDPAFDLGFALTHLLSKARHLPRHRQAFAESALLFWAAYRNEISSVDWLGTLEPHAVRHTLGCMLARVAGRSPLEYLSAVERLAQREAVLRLVSHPPESVRSLVDSLAGKGVASGA